MYDRPPLAVSNTLTTNAVANTATTHTLLAAVAAQQYRLYSIRMNLLQSEPAANVFRFLWPFVAGVSNFWGTVLQVGAVAGDGAIWPYPGVSLGSNVSISIQSVCTAVSRSFNVQVLYYIDVVT